MADHSDRPMTVADCARILGLSTQKVRDEIDAGELIARRSVRRSGRTLYRIERVHFDEYRSRVWPIYKPKQPKQPK